LARRAGLIRDGAPDPKNRVDDDLDDDPPPAKPAAK